MDFSKLPVTFEASIPEEYLDDMGHMNVMWYTHLFDKGVYGAFELIGLNLEYMRANHSGGFALESHIRYLREVRMGDKVTIYSRFIARTQRRFHLMNFMQNDSNDDVAATFEVVGAHIDMSIRRMSSFPTIVADKLDHLITEHSSLDWDAPLCGVMKP